MRLGGRRGSALVVTAAVVLTLLATPAGAGRGHGGGRGGHGAGRTVELQLLSFNDYHGHLEPPSGSDGLIGDVEAGGSAYLATTLEQLRQGNRNTLTVAAGDMIGGSPFLSGLFHDEPSVETLEAMGLDVTSVGNHEFDEGLDELLRMQDGGCHPVDGCYFPDEPYDGADFSWLAANVVHEDTGRSVLPPTWIEDVDGIEVGFIGMTLENTPELVAQQGIVGLEFEDEVETANRAARHLRHRGVKAIVVLLHEGGIQDGGYDGCDGISGPIVEIAEGLSPSIDLVVTGHTHQAYVCDIPDPAGHSRWVTSAASYGRIVTETDLVLDRRTKDVVRDEVTSVNHIVSRDVEPDPELTAIIAKWQEVSDPIANQVVGTIAEDITRSETRDAESALNNLIADAQLAATSDPGAGGAQIALMNPGGVRADLLVDAIAGGEQPGEVTYGEAFTVQPFGNLLVTMDLTGEQLDGVLEQQYIADRSRPQLILGVSDGLRFDYLLDGPEGERVTNISLDGEPIDPAATYRVTVNSFLADGGDAFTVLTEGTNRLGGGVDLDAFIAYLGANSPVPAPPTDRINEIG